MTRCRSPPGEAASSAKAATPRIARREANLKEQTLRRVFALLATLLVLVVVAQFFLAASGAFDTAPIDESFQPHRGLGYGIILFAILLTIVAALNGTGATSTTAGKAVSKAFADRGIL